MAGKGAMSVRKEYVLTLAGAVAAAAVAMGYQTPGSRMNKAETKIEDLQDKTASQETKIEVMAEDIKHIKRGVDRLLRGR